MRSVRVWPCETVTANGLVSKSTCAGRGRPQSSETGDQVSFVEITDETGLPALVEKRIDVLALHEDALFGRREVSFAGNAFVDSLL